MSDLSYSMSKSVHEGETFAYLCFFVLGLGNMFPWYAFVTAAPYYEGQFCNTMIERSFLSFFSMTYSASQPLALLVNICYVKRFSIQTLVRYPLLVFTIVFFITTILVLLPSVPALALFALTLVSLFICGIASAIMNGGLFALTGILPSIHTAACMSGQSLAGMMVAVVSLIVTASGPTDCSDGNDDDGACASSSAYGYFAYFLVACSVLVACMWLFVALLKQPFIIANMKAKLIQAFDGSEHVVSAMHHPGTLPAKSHDLLPKNTDFDLSHTLAVANMIKVPSYAVFITFTGTLMVFPSVMVQVEPVSSCHTSRFYGDLWVPMLFALYNAGDFLGRLLAHYFSDWNLLTADNIHIISTLRLAIPAMLLFCNIEGNRLAKLFVTDAVPPLLIAAVGMSGGFLANTAMMLAPTMVTATNASHAGTIMMFWLSSGLLVGSTLSFFWLYLITGSAV